MLSSSAVFISALIGIANAAQPTRAPTRLPTIVPSIAPSVLPTVQPSQPPTQWPTYEAGGWATSNFYSSDDELLIVTGKRTGVCIPRYHNTTDIVWYHYKISCGDTELKYYYYAPEDTACESEPEPYVETDMYGDLDGLQIGYTFIHDVSYFEFSCSPINSPFAALYQPESNHTMYYATEMIYPESNAENCTALGEGDVFTSYMEDRCFHYTRFTRNEDGEFEPSEYSGKFVPNWSPSEDIRFKKYVGSSCSDWNYDPVLENLHVINECSALRGEEATVHADVHISKHTLTPLDALVARGYRVVKGLEPTAAAKKEKAAKKAESAAKDLQEDFSSTYSYGYYAVDDDAWVVQLDTRGYYSMWMNVPEFPAPTAVPTVMPSHPTYRPTPADGEPTAAPTHMEEYTFSGWMTLTNIDQDLWYEKDSNTQSFIQAVAANMNSMDPDDITFGVVRNVHTSGERKLRGLEGSDGSSSNYVNDVLVDFQVTFVLATVNYPNITEAYDALTGALYDGVIHTGLFDHLLQSYSADNGGSLDHVKSTDVGFGEPEVVEAKKDHPKSTHSGLIVGIIIGLGVGLACIGAMFYWVFYGSG